MRVNSKSLRSALQACARAADRRISLPVLSCAKLEAKAGRLTITASNLDVWVERHADCEGDLEPCCVNLNLLLKAVEHVDAESCELKLNGKLVLKAGKSVDTFNTVPSNDFPLWPTAKLTPTAVNCADLATGLNAVSWGCADESIGRPELENVAIQLSEAQILCLAANGNLLAHYRKAAIAAPCAFQVPCDFIAALVSALEEPHSLLALSDNHVECTYEAGRTLVKLSDIGFIKGWERVLEIRSDKPSTRIQTELLKQPTATCLLYHEKQTPQLDLEWVGEAITLSILGDLAQKEMTIPCVGDGKGEAHMNAKYLSKALPKFGDEVKFTPCDNASFWESGDLTVAIFQMRARR